MPLYRSIKVNKAALEQAIIRSPGMKESFTALAREAATERFEKMKRGTLMKFDKHPITKEIKAGPTAGSSLLGYGNLFSFLGFQAEAKPVENLRAFLQNSIELGPIPTRNSNLKRFYFKAFFPTREEIVEATSQDLEWGTFDSWVYAVEEGISNLNMYLFERGKTLENSRSGPGIQVKKPIRGDSFEGIPYMTEIMEYFANYKGDIF